MANTQVETPCTPYNMREAVRAAASDIPRLTYNMQEAARALGVSDPTMQAIARLPGFPGVRVGKRWLIPCDLLKAWIEDQARAQSVHNGCGA